MHFLKLFTSLQKEFEASLVFDTTLHRAYIAARETEEISPDLLLELAPHLEAFLGSHFGIVQELSELNTRYNSLAPVMHVKRQFVQRYALKKYPSPGLEMPEFNFETEALFTQNVLAFEANPNEFSHGRELMAQYAAWASLTPQGQQKHKGSILFSHPQTLNPHALLKHTTKCNDGRLELDSQHLGARDGFNLTDDGISGPRAYHQANYCIWCHKQGKDSCSKGMTSKTESTFKQDALGNTLTGCPLDQKISEMNLLISQGYILGALAVVMIDNPLVAATGHRICNACMKACIFQKQDAVDIPGVETRILKDILELPYGFEIYKLLAWWNPLHVQQPLPHPAKGHNVLVAGMGPSGFTLAYYLLRSGHNVVGVDGLKIEPLQPPKEPIKHWQEYVTALDERVIQGFGGVAEYGITARWDKNFLTAIRLVLESHPHFTLKGCVRLGGTITITQALKQGFNHVALCLGAGNPKVPSIPNAFAKGVRHAYDFLMALNLTGIGQKGHKATFPLRLPALVVGGGLTAIDTATELMAYYIKFAEDSNSTDPELMEHARLITQERTLATQEKRAPNFIPLLQRWGGVTLVYRSSLTKAPSYRLNHEEIQKALEEGITIMDDATPVNINVDETGNATSLTISRQGKTYDLPGKSIFMAAGTSPNRNICLDESTTLNFDTTNDTTFFVNNTLGQGRISHFGDMHSQFAGSVVKAMASAKHGYKAINTFLESLPSTPDKESFDSKLFDATLHYIMPHGENSAGDIGGDYGFEITIHAPMAAANFQPGHFYRVQLYGQNSKPMALRPIHVEPEKGLLYFWVNVCGETSQALVNLTPGSSIALMGPTGEAVQFPKMGDILVIGEGYGLLQLLPFAKAATEKGLSVTLLWVKPKALPPHIRSYISNAGDTRLETENLQDVQLNGSIKRVYTSGSPALLRKIQALQEGVWKTALEPECEIIVAMNTPMQCMLKAICARCIQPTKDGTGYYFACAKPNQNLGDIVL